METIFIVGNPGICSEAAKLAISELKNQGHKVIITKDNEMKKEHLKHILGLSMFAESIANQYPHIGYADTSKKTKHETIINRPKQPKKIPKDCKVWKIGKYNVYALNKKNAIRKALNLRKQEQESFDPDDYKEHKREIAELYADLIINKNK